jgi:tetratricopeptide (TPR) repeat protein
LKVTALSYLTDALRQDKQTDQALHRVDELLERATLYGFRGHIVLALRDKGQLLASKGEKREALECLRKAVALRRALSDEEIKAQTVVTLEAFLDALGQVAARFGQYDEAIEAFGELAELQGQAGDLVLKVAQARLKLKTANPDDIRNRLGDVNLPGNSQPFSESIYADAFQCFGSW